MARAKAAVKKTAKKTTSKTSKKAPNVNVKVTKTSAAKAKVSKTAKTAKTAKATVQATKQTRIQILKHLAERSDLTKVQVEKVFDELVVLIESHMKKRGSGEFTIPGTGVKIRRVKKKASKARKMVSPLTGEEVTIAAKPARQSVKVSALKVLKEMVNG